MANIKSRDLASVTETSLFSNSESFIQELSDDELNLSGGFLMEELSSLSPFEYPKPWK